MKRTVVVGMPHFDNFQLTSSIFPLESVQLFKRIAKDIKNERKFKAKIAQEYYSILQAVYVMGYDVRICCLECFPHKKDDIQKRLGFSPEVVIVENNFPNAIYVRDSWTLIDETILVSSYMPKRELSFKHEGQKVATSIFGEGGKVFSVGNYFFTTSLTDTDHPQKFSTFLKTEDHLPKIDKKFVLLPNAVILEEMKGESIFALECHVDRFMSVIFDRNGEVHVILDPTIRVGYQHMKLPPRFSIRESLDEVSGILKEHGIQHVHIPAQPLNIPYALGAMQFYDGKILMSSGTNVENLYRDIVGRENVVTTDMSIIYYSSILRSGIRCLINEY